jgi:hypothetical protein
MKTEDLRGKGLRAHPIRDVAAPKYESSLTGWRGVTPPLVHAVQPGLEPHHHHRGGSMTGNDYGSDLEFVVAVLVISVCLLVGTLVLEFISERRDK